MSSASVDVATKLGFGLFENESNVSGRAILISVLLAADDVEPFEWEDMPDGTRKVLFNKRSAFGIRLALKLTEAKTNSRLSFGVLSAENDTSASKVEVDKQTRGFSTDLNVFTVGIGHELDAATLGTIRELLSRCLPEHIKKVVKEGGELGTGTIIERNPDSTSDDGYSPCKAINYGITKVAQRIALSDALKPSWLSVADRAVVRQIYARYRVGEGAPGADAAGKAKEWIEAARRRK